MGPRSVTRFPTTTLAWKSHGNDPGGGLPKREKGPQSALLPGEQGVPISQPVLPDLFPHPPLPASQGISTPLGQSTPFARVAKLVPPPQLSTTTRSEPVSWRREYNQEATYTLLVQTAPPPFSFPVIFLTPGALYLVSDPIPRLHTGGRLYPCPDRNNGGSLRACDIRQHADGPRS